MSIDDIWDEPIASPQNATTSSDAQDTSSSTLKRPRQSLFLSDSDSEHERPPPKRATPAPPNPELDALFENLDDDADDAGIEDLRYKPLAPALDLAQLTRDAEAKHARAKKTGGGPAFTPHQVMPSSSPPREGGGEAEKEKGADNRGGGEEGKKARKKPAILDEARLVGPTGFPALIEDVKGFKPKGKGHEHTDLNRILQVYQFWTHRMYPKTTFKDTVNRIEKLCHSKRMQVRLSVWRDEAKGIVNGKKPGEDDDADIIDLTEPTIVGTGSGDEEKEDQPRRTRRDSESSPTPSLPPSSSEPDDDFDIDAVIRAEEERRAASSASAAAPKSPSPGPAATAKASYREDPDAHEMDVDEAAMWDDLDALENAPPPLQPPRNAAPSSASKDNDEDMWDIVNEIEGSGQTRKKPAVGMQMPISSVIVSAPSEETGGSGTVSRATNDDDWDEMYL
ncbi:replication fork protection component Swi3-domain-containing protein [Phlebopus sp. FC_14]|nr:replication fork protection component Swi3-domain-containing protein [Phlebopus sp. FC_14]